MRGIVTCAGGPLYFLNAYINCYRLRLMGCQLPIEWFYLGNEMETEWIPVAEKIEGVHLINLGGTRKIYDREFGGWQSKIEAIISSSFDETMWLDADCFPLRDPAYLFDHPFYTETGAVLFPDQCSWNTKELENLRHKFHVPTLPTLQVEGGQMMFNKPRCMAGLEAARKLNRNSDETYRVLDGDKDTFMIGMLQAGCDFRVNPHLSDSSLMGFVQKDFDGQQLFLHAMGTKFRWDFPIQVFRLPTPPIIDIPQLMSDLKIKLNL